VVLVDLTFILATEEEGEHQVGGGAANCKVGLLPVMLVEVGPLKEPAEGAVLLATDQLRVCPKGAVPVKFIVAPGV
jgi:hypothetical protein